MTAEENNQQYQAWLATPDGQRISRWVHDRNFELQVKHDLDVAIAGHKVPEPIVASNGIQSGLSTARRRPKLGDSIVAFVNGSRRTLPEIIKAHPDHRRNAVGGSLTLLCRDGRLKRVARGVYQNGERKMAHDRLKPNA